MSEDVKQGLGQAILNGIIRENLATAVQIGLIVFRAASAEVLESIVEDWRKNSRLCTRCANHAILGETDPDGAFLCCDCLPPENP